MMLSPKPILPNKKYQYLKPMYHFFKLASITCKVIHSLVKSLLTYLLSLTVTFFLILDLYMRDCLRCEFTVEATMDLNAENK